MFIKLSRTNDVKMVEIDGVVIPNVAYYKITTSESGETEVELKFKVNSSIETIEMSTN